MTAIPSPINSTVAAIYRGYEERRGEELRPHLGASQIGHPCSRALWYGFRWALTKDFDGRMLRLFDTGQREEDRLICDLRHIGVEVHAFDPEGNQWRVSAHGGHFGGSMDGCAVGIPEAPKTWHVLEFKTHNIKSFTDLQAKGVMEAKPMHYAQMQVYMELTGMTRALYLAVCKNDDQIHAERVEHDPVAAAKLLAKAERIIFSDEPPARISDNASWWECKFCDYHPICHGEAIALVNCRTCAHVTAARDGTWRCEADHPEDPIDPVEQRHGCHLHRYNPHLLANVAEYLGGNGKDAEYRDRKTGRVFWNGDGTSGLTSRQIAEGYHV
jgi:hypothetical protein